MATLAVSGGLALALAIGSSQTSAQGPAPEFNTGKNVDIIGPHGAAPYDPAGSNPFFMGDPDKKQQNEPSCDVSPNNPLIVFCGFNSYSSVDRPDIGGEPWIGASFTMDGGLTWKSHLHPGFKPKAPDAPAPLVAPIGWDTAADPVVRLAPGIGLYAFIAFNRSGNGAFLLGRWFERSIESGFPYAWKDTIEIAKGTGSPGQSGRFLDKPVMTLSMLPGSSTYNFTVPDPTPTQPLKTRVQKVPAGIVHVAYAVFTGNSQQDGTKIIYTRSTNYGDSWDPGTTLSESQSINQAADIATDPATHRVVVVWRRFADPNAQQSDAIMSAISNDDGRSFGKPTLVANICSFTQNSTSTSFRTTTHPFVTFDGTAFHAIWAQRQGTSCPASPTGYSRIVMSNLSFTGNNAKWSNPAVVDSASPSSRRGHEFQPAIAVAGNRMLVSWMDTRNDTAYPDPPPDPYVNDYIFVMTQGTTKVRRRAADIYAAEAIAGQTPTFGAPKQVSRYLSGIFPGDPTPRALERNKVNPRMFQSGKVPFHGDYTSAAAVRFVPRDPVAFPGEWVSSAGAANVQPVFHLAWTDNRLVRGDVSAGLADATGTIYTPPPISAQSETDPTTPRGGCSAATAGTRDQSVFTARVTPTIVLLTASASKPTVFSGNAIQRSYSVFVQNTSTTTDKTITIDIVPPTPTTVTASFRKITTEFPNPVLALPLPADPTPLTLPRRSSLARTIYVTSPVSIERPAVKINVRENNTIVATTYLNPNPHAAPLDDPLDPNDRITSEEQVDSVEVHIPDILYRATSIGTPAIDDPAIDDPAIDDPAIDDPAIDDPAIDDPAIDDPAIDDPAIDDPAIDDPAIDDPAIDDAAIDSAAIASSSISDPDASPGQSNSGEKLTQITWKVALKGNTTTSMTSKVFLNVTNAQLAALKGAIGTGKSQMLVSRRYKTNDVRGSDCTPVRVSSYQVIANVVNPELTNIPTPPDLVNPTSSEPSFAIPPGGAVYITFRVWGNITGFNPNRVGTVVRSQPGPPAGEPLDSDLPADQTEPVLTLPGLTVNAEAAGPQGAIVTFTATANDDFDGPVPVSCSPASGATFPVGTTPVTCSAEDATGNEATGTFSVVVSDTNAPVISGTPANITVIGGAGGAVVTYPLPTALDSVAGTRPVTCSPASGSTFVVGTTTVTCTASDTATPTPNTASSTFTVTVTLDNVGPTITDTATPALLWPPDGAMVTVTVSGVANDSQSGMSTIAWSVDDEYNQVEPFGSKTVTNGPFSFQIVLKRERRGNDKDGRHYIINVTATDKAGNQTLAVPIVVNVHDQSGG